MDSCCARHRPMYGLVSFCLFVKIHSFFPTDSCDGVSEGGSQLYEPRGNNRPRGRHARNPPPLPPPPPSSLSPPPPPQRPPPPPARCCGVSGYWSYRSSCFRFTLIVVFIVVLFFFFVIFISFVGLIVVIIFFVVIVNTKPSSKSSDCFQIFILFFSQTSEVMDNISSMSTRHHLFSMFYFRFQSSQVTSQK